MPSFASSTLAPVQTLNSTPGSAVSYSENLTNTLSVVLFHTPKLWGVEENHWAFYKIAVGSKVDVCSVIPELKDYGGSWDDPKAIDNPPWPQGTFAIPEVDEVTIGGSRTCQYVNDGNGAGSLHCPSQHSPIGCKEDSEKSQTPPIQTVSERSLIIVSWYVSGRETVRPAWNRLANLYKLCRSCI